MKQQTIDTALEVLKERREKATASYNKRLDDLKTDTTFTTLALKYTELKINNARAYAYGESPDRTEELNLKAKYDKYFEGYTPEYTCKKCNDKGYIEGNMCECLKREISKVLYKESNFGRLVSFEEAKKSIDSSLLECYDLMERWTNSDFKKNLVFISGQVGIGKTYLTRAMAHNLIKRGKVTRLVTAFEMSKDFKEYRFNYEDYNLEKYIDCEVLFIDDLGNEIIYKNSTVELLYLVINERKLKNLATVITSNLDLTEILNRYGERTYSRILDKETSICIKLAGSDRRTTKQ